MKQKTPRLAQFEITEFSKEGHGVAEWQRADGENVKVEVPFTLPGDKVLVDVLKRHKGLYQSHFLELIESSPKRVKPICQHFGVCGGCRWQHIEYSLQLNEKESEVYKLFEAYLTEKGRFYSILPCDPPLYYRNKMEFSFSSDKNGNRFLGLIMFGSRGKVFQMQECHLIHPWAVKVIECVSKWWEESRLDAYYGGKDSGSLRTLTVREGQRTGDRLIMLTVSGNPDYSLSQKQLNDFVEVLRASVEPEGQGKLSIFLRIQQIAKGKPTQFYEMLLYGPSYLTETLYLTRRNGSIETLTFSISPMAFFQPNTKQAEKLYARAIELTEPSTNDIVYDLYCGTGTLGISIASQVKEVVGIEIVPEAVLDAQENIRKNHLTNVTVHRGDVGDVLEYFDKEKFPKPDIVMVDPPRAGLDSKAIEYILKLKAPKLTYISCNPITQVANLEALIKGGYFLTAVQPVDQFPQTRHVENIIILTKHF